MTRRAATSTTDLAGRLAALSIAAFVAGRASGDPDLWGHLRFGLDLLQARRLPAVDPYSFTQDVAWINHEWLSELVFAFVYRAGGVGGLTLLKTALVAATVLLLASLVRPMTARGWWVLAVAVAGLAPSAMTFRPQLWTLFLLALLARILAGGASLAWIPLVFLFWANLHGGWVVGAGVVLLFALGAWFETRRLRPALGLAATLAAGLLATLVNPYGWRLWLFLVTTVGPTRPIDEWRPLWERSDPAAVLLWLASAVAAIVVIAKSHGPRAWRALLPAACLGFAGLFVARLAPLFAITLPLLARAFGGVPSGGRAQAGDSAVPLPASDRRAPALVAVDAVLVGGIWISLVVPSVRCLPIAGPWAPDLKTAAALASPSLQGRLVVPFNWGEYALWHFGPRLRVSIDGRRETVYSARTEALQSAVAHGQPDGLQYLDRERPEVVWLPSTTGARTRAWLLSSGYQIVDSDAAFVASRHDQPPPALSPALSNCFP